LSLPAQDGLKIEWSEVSASGNDEYSTKWFGKKGADELKIVTECETGKIEENVRALVEEGGYAAHIFNNLVGTVTGECERAGGGKVEVLFEFDTDFFSEVVVGSTTYVLKIVVGEDPAVVGRVHCDGIGLEEEQCLEVIEMLRMSLEDGRREYMR